MASFKPSSKRLPSQLSELIDIAIFSFSSLSGLRSSHKVRGDPVIDGVCCLFGRLVECSRDETKNIFKEVSPARLGGWTPGSETTKELSTLISSRLKQAKEKQNIREHEDPCAPEQLLRKKQTFDEQRERVITRVHPQCWRCKHICQYCKLKRQNIVASLKTEVTSPLLDVLEEMAEDITEVSNSGDEDEGEFIDDRELEIGRRLTRQCVSETDLTDDDSTTEEAKTPSEGVDDCEVDDCSNESND